jgi:hypothetical protein
MARRKKTQTVAAKFNYNPDYYGRFLHLLKAHAYNEYGDDVDLPLASRARESLAALATNDSLRAAYAAFQFGFALSYQTGWEKAVDAMLRGKGSTTPSQDEKREAVALFNRLKEEHPDWKHGKIERAVERQGGPKSRTLRRWRKELGA